MTFNAQVTMRLDEVGELLREQGASPFRVHFLSPRCVRLRKPQSNPGKSKCPS